MRTQKRAKSVSFGKKKETPVNEAEKEHKKVATSEAAEPKKAVDSEEKKHAAPNAVDAEVKKETTSHVAESKKEETHHAAHADKSHTTESKKHEEKPEVKESSAEKEKEDKENKEEVKEEKKDTPNEDNLLADEKGEEPTVVEEQTTVEEDPLEKDLKSLKEPEDAKSDAHEEAEKEEVASAVNMPEEKEEVEEKVEATSEVENDDKPQEKEEQKTDSVDVSESAKPSKEKSESKEENPFIVKDSAFGNVDGLYDKKKKNPIGFFLLVAAVSFVLGLVVMAGAEYWMKQANIKLPEIASIANSNPTPTKAPEPTPIRPDSTVKAEEPKAEESKKDVDLSAYTVRVLNGSGVKGEAARVKTLLTNAGFKVTAVGNADLSDYKETEVQAKKGVDKEYLKQLEAVLAKTYVVDDPSTPPSGASQTTDVVVIIGSSTN